MYNTNNPVEPNGSTDPRDISDNAQVLDLLVNSDQIEVTGRTGKKLKGIAALQAIIKSLDLGSFTFADIASGLAGTVSGQYFRVPQGADKNVAFIYYRNMSGTAVEVAKLPGASSILRFDNYDSESSLRKSEGKGSSSALNTLTGDLYQWIDGHQTDELANTFISRMSTPPTPAQSSAINQLFADLRAASLLEVLDGLWVGVSTSKADSLLNLLSNNYTLTEKGTVTYDKTAGWTFSLNNYFDTGLSMASSGIKLSEDSVSIGCTMNGGDTTDGSFMGALSNSSGISLSVISSKTMAVRLNNIELATADISVKETATYQANRADKNNVSLFINGDLIAKDEYSPVVRDFSGSISLGRSTSGQGYQTNYTMSAAYVGSSLTEGQTQLLSDAIKRYIYTFTLSTSLSGYWKKLPSKTLSPSDLISAINNASESTPEMVVADSYAKLSALQLPMIGRSGIAKDTGRIYTQKDINNTSNFSVKSSAFISRLTTAPNDYQLAAIKQFFETVGAAGILDIADAIYLGVSTSYNDSLLNLASSSYTLTTTAAPNWASNTGWSFPQNGKSYLDTNFNPATVAGPHFKKYDFSAATLFAINGTQKLTGHIMGNFDGANGFSLAPVPSSPNAQVRFNQKTPVTFGSNTLDNAIYVATRKGNKCTLLKNGEVFGVVENNPVDVASANFLIGGSKNSTEYLTAGAYINFAYIGSGLTELQSRILTNAVRRYNSVFNSTIPSALPMWLDSGMTLNNTASEPAAPLQASFSLPLSTIGQQFKGGYIEIQPDSFIGGTEPATDSTTEEWGFPQSLLASEQDRLREMVLPGGGVGIQYLRLPLGFAYRGFRNIDEETGLAKNIGERYSGQNDALKRLLRNVDDTGGLAPEYWCPAPYWVVNGKYAGSTYSVNKLWAGGNYARSVSLDSIRASDGAQYSAQLSLVATAMLDDLEYLHQNVGAVRMYGLQNEPQYGHELYGTCQYTDAVYSDLLSKLQPLVADSKILSEYNGVKNTPLLYAASDNDFGIGKSYIAQNSDKIWGYSHHNITPISTDADWLKGSAFLSLKGSKSNVFVNETEYMNPENSGNEWKAANNMLRDVHNLVFGGAEVVMPIIHICKQLGESSSYTSNTDGYALFSANLPSEFGIPPGSNGNEKLLGYGSFSANPWNYNAFKLVGDNLEVGAINVTGSISISVAGIGIAAFISSGKLKLFLVNRNNSIAKISVTLPRWVKLSGKAYNIRDCGVSCGATQGDILSINVPAYTGQCWIEV